MSETPQLILALQENERLTEESARLTALIEGHNEKVAFQNLPDHWMISMEGE